MIGLTQINNWGIKKFVLTVTACQLLLLGLVGLSTLGLEIPMLRQAVGFICLAFVPGLVILRLLKLNKLGSVETVLYSVGLSTAFVMFLGLPINILYPLIGISKPISLAPIIVTLTSTVLIMCLIVYIRDRRVMEPPHQNSSSRWSYILSPPAWLILLLPTMGTLGAFLVYGQQGNLLLLILLSLIALIVILVASGFFIPTNLFPWTVAAIGLSLVLHNSLISPSLSGFDIHYHYYLQQLVISNSLWDISIGTMSNSMLSITILAPFYSLLLNMDGTWVFKIVYPLLFSLVPLALFQILKEQMDDKTAFLGAFFFMSFPAFFFTVPSTATQMIVELFIALSILLLIKKGMNAFPRALLLIVFSLSIIVSHYGLSYLYALLLILALTLQYLSRTRTINRLWHTLTVKLSKLSGQQAAARGSFESSAEPGRSITISTNYVVLIIVSCLTWYIYTSTGATFYSLVKIGDHVLNSLSQFLLPATRDPQVLQALGQVPMRAAELEWEIARVFQYVTQVFIVVGIIGLITSLHRTRFHPIYIAMVMAGGMLIVISITVPYFASSLGMARVYHLVLFFWAPLCITGGITIFHWLLKGLSRHRFHDLATSTLIKPVAIVLLVPYFLFTSGFIFELSGATPTSMPLSLYKTDWSFFTQPEISASEWLGDVEGGQFITYGDAYGETQLPQYGVGASIRLPFKLNEISQDSYMFLRQWNIEHGELLFFTGEIAETHMTYINLKDELCQDIFNGRGKLYDNGQAQVYGYK